MREKMMTTFNKMIDTCSYLVDDILSLKKFYSVEIYDSGQWGTVAIGTRFFLTYKSAIDFYTCITDINKCNAKFKTYSRLSGTCYGEI